MWSDLDQAGGARVICAPLEPVDPAPSVAEAIAIIRSQPLDAAMVDMRPYDQGAGNGASMDSEGVVLCVGRLKSRQWRVPWVFDLRFLVCLLLLAGGRWGLPSLKNGAAS